MSTKELIKFLLGAALVIVILLAVDYSEGENFKSSHSEYSEPFHRGSSK